MSACIASPTSLLRPLLTSQPQEPEPAALPSGSAPQGSENAPQENRAPRGWQTRGAGRGNGRAGCESGFAEAARGPLSLPPPPSCASVPNHVPSFTCSSPPHLPAPSSAPYNCHTCRSNDLEKDTCHLPMKSLPMACRQTWNETQTFFSPLILILSLIIYFNRFQ